MIKDNDMEIHECKGCLNYVDSGSCDAVGDDSIPLLFISGCPCIECLVKSMCITTCSALKDGIKISRKYFDRYKLKG